MSVPNFREIQYFYQFNALRFFAAFLVLLHHAESLRKNHNLENWKAIGLFKNGSNAVTFFFVLSGFLITYLLLKEHSVKGSISIKQFYWKRILRIWPLYFLLIIIGVILQPLIISGLGLDYQMPYTFSETWAYFLFFLPGMVTFYFGNHLLEPLWSIGVEEIFYLIWAPVFRYLKRALLYILIAFILIKWALLHMSGLGYFSESMSYLIRILQFESMAFGGLAAYLLYHYGASLSNSILRANWFTWGLIVFILLIVFFHDSEKSIYWNSVIVRGEFSIGFKSFFFALFLLTLALSNKLNAVMDSRILNYLGEISYGIYMYHLVVITATVELIMYSKWGMMLDSTLYYSLSIILTLTLAAISKHTIEAYFLKFKNRI